MILCTFPIAPSPTPSRQRMLRRWVLCSHSRRGWDSFGTAPTPSRPAAERWPISCLDTISQAFGPAPRYFFKAGQSGPMVPKRRDSPTCGAASPSIGSKEGIGSGPVTKQPWPKPKHVPGKATASYRLADLLILTISDKLTPVPLEPAELAGRTAFESHNGRPALAARTVAHAPFLTLRECRQNPRVGWKAAIQTLRKPSLQQGDDDVLGVAEFERS